MKVGNTMLIWSKLLLVGVIALGFYLSSCVSRKVSSVPAIDSSLIANATNTPAVDTEYYAMVEKPASFQNGDIKLFITYLKKSIRYPANALKKKQQGTVAVQFGVDCYGAVKVFSVLKSSGSKLIDDEAVRAIKTSPKWLPAHIKEKSVGQLFLLQIKFNLKTKGIEIH